MNDKLKFAVFLVVPALLVLFVLQLVSLAGFELLAPIGAVRWPLFGACFVLAGFGVGWALRVLGRSRKFDLADASRSWLVAVWGLVWLAAWLGLYAWLAGTDPTRWELSVMMASPKVLFAFVACGFGLWIEPRRRMATH